MNWRIVEEEWVTAYTTGDNDTIVFSLQAMRYETGHRNIRVQRWSRSKTRRPL